MQLATEINLVPQLTPFSGGGVWWSQTEQSGHDHTIELAASEWRTNLRAPAFCYRDLDFDQVTLELECNPDILKMYLHTEREIAKTKTS